MKINLTDILISLIFLTLFLIAIFLINFLFPIDYSICKQFENQTTTCPLFF